MFLLCMQTNHGIHILPTYIHTTPCMLMYCGRKGHLAKFYYDKVQNVNFANKFVWVRKGANPHGPKIVWIPEATPILFDVGVGCHLM